MTHSKARSNLADSTRRSEAVDAWLQAEFPRGTGIALLAGESAGLKRSDRGPRAWKFDYSRRKEVTLDSNLLILIIVLVILFGGGGFYWKRRR
jgi:hypothetical protein